MNSTSGYGNSTLSHSFTCNQETMETGDSDSGDMDSTSINEVHRVMPDTVEDDQVGPLSKMCSSLQTASLNFENGWLHCIFSCYMIYNHMNHSLSITQFHSKALIKAF